MTWFASGVNEVESQRSHYLPFIAVDFDFPSGHIRLWTGIGDLPLLGNTYTGIGDLAKIDGESESADLNLQRRKYILSGVDPTSVDESDITDSFGRSVTEYLGFLDPETRALIATPETYWEGRIDSIRRVDGENPIIEVSSEHRLAILDRTDQWRYTHEHQQQFYPSGGDLGYDQVNAIALKKVVWGGKVADPGATVITPLPSPIPRFR